MYLFDKIYATDAWNENDAADYGAAYPEIASVPTSITMDFEILLSTPVQKRYIVLQKQTSANNLGLKEFIIWAE